MKIEFVASAEAAEVLAVLVHEGRAFVGMGTHLDTATSGGLTKAMTHSRFTGATNSTLIVAAPAGVDAATIVLTGAGAATIKVLLVAPVNRLCVIAFVRPPLVAVSRWVPMPTKARPS